MRVALKLSDTLVAPTTAALDVSDIWRSNSVLLTAFVGVAGDRTGSQRTS